MQRLVYYKLRILALTLLILISSVIVYSYLFLPANVAITISDFYKAYWYLLTKLFIVTAVFLLFAYSVERDWLAISWQQWLVAAGLLMFFTLEFIRLINTAGLLLALVN
jgi:hypothetical protein